ncbi:VPLPA-CTERM protein sorting domain-containing protein [Jannaschia seohaensis]|uniref:Putative secreted protein n=1 Tax=Jannaschia seohaensis TaxID=475081 RepID=A0A2Y9AQ31_9RHOB|nr:putative secreted protein [Jannaschia seohaensis]SSA46581.1 VPLPA-CTERM protein sorting domain-containing protein [Jannaschia seohaensis]
MNGLGIALSAGTYWIGLTPVFDWQNQIARLDTFTSAAQGPSDALLFGPTFGGPGGLVISGIIAASDANIRIDGSFADGVVPLPAGVFLLLGGLGALGMTARRRAA